MVKSVREENQMMDRKIPHIVVPQVAEGLRPFARQSGGWFVLPPREMIHWLARA